MNNRTAWNTITPTTRDVVIRFNNDGSAKCLWTEAIDLSAIGTLQVHRASTIEFDNHLKHWIVKVDGLVIFNNKSREACLDFEHRQLNEALAEGRI